MDEVIASLFKEAEQRVTNTKSALEKLGQELGYKIIEITGEEETKKDGPLASEEKIEVKHNSATINKEIYEALLLLSPILANSYIQVKTDLNDTNRVSWAGTAHEIRQTVSTMLHMLAPDNEVKAEPGYKQEPNTEGPTQKQRAAYILKKRGAGSRITDVVEKVVKFEELIAELVRHFYSRASDAAHRSKDKRETQRLLNYFEAFAHDLLDI